MATRAMRKKGQADWRAAFRRSMRRAGQMAGAGGLLILLIFLALAMASYTQTDPSGSTAASGSDIRNWMGASGAWAADKVLGTFGITSILLLPLIYIGARGLWREVEHEDEDEGTRWWLPLGMLL
ncbi:MAG: DNA translocase FtsK, partial [Altererythrobacter sp.]|nr:DNA translocase FtsK [Altererythrobacter sp.]